MATLSNLWIPVAIVLCHCCYISTATTNIDYVKPSEMAANVNCTHLEPCLTLNEYAINADVYFLNNTTFVFLPGIHWLNHSISLENLSNVIFQAYSDAVLQMETRVRVYLSSLVNITWTSCDGVRLHDLDIVLGGKPLQPFDNNIFSALAFHRTTTHFSNMTIFGNTSLRSTAILLNDSSRAVISSLTVSGATSSSGAALYALGSHIEFHGQNVFESNIATDHSGGAMALYGCNSSFLGNMLFQNNSAHPEGGAVFITGGSVDVLKDTFFVENRAGQYGGALSISNVKSNVKFENVSFIKNYALFGGAVSLTGEGMSLSGNGLFVDNEAERGGGAMVLLSGDLNISGHFRFVHNSCDHFGGAVMLYTNSSNMSGYFEFLDNSVYRSAGGALAIFARKGVSVITGDILFDSNTAARNGGALYGETESDAHIMVSGNVKFVNNSVSGFGGAVCSAGRGGMSIVGLVQFIQNRATSLSPVTPISQGGAILATDSLVNLEGSILFEENSASLEHGSGGAIYALRSTVNLTGTQYFNKNSARLGGAIALDSDCLLILTEPLQLILSENYATDYGGAIYSSKVISVDQCERYEWTDSTTIPECIVQLSDYYSSNIHLTFVNNTADRAGRIIYGGALDRCKHYMDGREIDECGHRTGGNYDIHLIKRLLSISDIHSIDDNQGLDISSEPHQVCICHPDGNIDCLDLDNKIMSVKVAHGEEFTLQAVTVGQNEGLVASAVRVAHSNDVEMNAEQTIQNTSVECTPIKYRPYSGSNDTTIILFPDDSPCRDIGISRTEIKVTFDKCPNGFDFNVREKKCLCENRLQKYTENCTIDDRSIQRSASDTFWMGAFFDNGTYRGLILHSNCPLDYCIDYPVSITLDDLDIQCNHNHSGTLCGSCTRGNSIAFGTLHCLQCSNQYLALMLPFSLAGVALVAVLLLLNISVATGAINALIFYANIIQVNRSIFLPLDKVNILTVFVAWINLDLGIETCFYDGMTVYAFTWLQFLFPFYVWFLIGSIIVVTHFSQRATQLLGHNPVAALATLFLLSYSKILRTIIMALSITHLDYPDDTRKWVWLYNASVPYFKGVAHTTLGLFSIVVLLLLFLPYTLLLTCGHWLQAHSDWKALSWLNKIKPFMDAYHAPYKKGTRHWTGFLLLVRCALFLTFALNAFGDENVNLLAITSATVVLLALASLHGGIYESSFVNVLEISFMVNLCLFSAATYHVKQTTSQGKQAPWLAYTFVGVAFVAFIVIVLYHVYLIVRKTPRGKKLLTFFGKHGEERGFDQSQRSLCKQSDMADQSPTTTFIDIREYEPLLDRN